MKRDASSKSVIETRLNGVDDDQPVMINQINFQQNENDLKMHKINTMESRMSHRARKYNKSMHKQDNRFPGKFFYWTENDEDKISNDQDEVADIERSF